MAPKFRGRADTREHEQLRRLKRPGAQDDFAAGRDELFRPGVLHLDAARRSALDADFCDGRVCQRGEIGVAQDGLQVGDRGAGTFAVAGDRVLVECGAIFLARPVVIPAVAAIKTEFAGGLDKCMGQQGVDSEL